MRQHTGTRLLHACLKMRRQLNKLATAGNLSQGEYLVLRHIWLAGTAETSESITDGSLFQEGLMKSNQIRPGSLKAADLSDQLNRPRPAITRILNALEERGLIVRTIDPDDRRSINISLTEEGGAALQKANDTILEVAERIVLSLGESETEKLIQLLGRLTDIFEDILGEAGGNSDE